MSFVVVVFLGFFIHFFTIAVLDLVANAKLLYICNMMKRFTILLLLAATFVAMTSAPVIRTGRLRPRLGDSISQPPSKPQKLYSDNTLIIHYNGKKGKKSLLKAVKSYGATVIYEYKNFNSISIMLPSGADVHKAKTHFEKVKGVLQVNYDRIMRLM